MVVLDASAVLALISQEPGADTVAGYLPDATMSAVNVAEVIVKHVDRGADPTGVASDLEALGIRIEPVGLDDARLHAQLRRCELAAVDDRPVLSLGDRCCLALGQRLGAPVVTADRAWARLGLPVDVVVIR